MLREPCLVFRLHQCGGRVLERIVSQGAMNALYLADGTFVHFQACRIGGCYGALGFIHEIDRGLIEG